jgi:hypothetical protein
MPEMQGGLKGGIADRAYLVVRQVVNRTRQEAKKDKEKKYKHGG